jgi:predicted phage terminase large subunit-like protein
VFKGNEHGSYLIDVFRGSEEYSNLKSIALALHQKYNPRLHLIEDASLGRALGADLKEHGANAIMLPTGAASKLDRLLAQLHLIKGQRVFLPKTAPWLEKFLDELVAFPHGSRDDQVDALTQYLKWYGDRANEPPVPKYVSIGIQHGAPRSARRQDMILRNTPMIPPRPTGGLRRRR